MPAAYLKAPALEVVQTCRKIRYESRQLAREVKQKTERSHQLAEYGHGVLVIYRCRWCKGFHIGHETATTRQARREKRMHMEAA